MAYINYNGKILDEKQLYISHTNRAFRYADGFFETMRLINGKIILQDLHLERLYASLQIMKFEVENFPSYLTIVQQIAEIAKRNSHLSSGRVRLTIFAGNGSLNDVTRRSANYIIETSTIETPTYSLNNKGAVVDIFKDAVKTADNFSSVKSNNFLPYVMASIWAKEKRLDDAILLNAFNNVADATIANIFIVKDGIIQTSRLVDGPVNGVMRRYVLQCFKKDGIPFREASINPEDLESASEVFLTNAIVGIKWVEKVGPNNYTQQTSRYLFDNYIVPLNG